MPDISGQDGPKPTMLIMDNDRMALMALQSILSKALPDFELLPPVSEGSKAIQLCTATKHPPAVLLASIAVVAFSLRIARTTSGPLMSFIAISANSTAGGCLVAVHS